MIMNQHQMDIISNNLANINKNAFKKDEAIFKSFPEMLLQRSREDGLGSVPLGSFDLAPIVGKLGTGVSLHENFTHFMQGGMKKTDNPFDLALDDTSTKKTAFFVVQTNRGERLTRNGNFTLDKNGNLVTSDGFPLMGEKGIIQVAKHNVLIQENGEIWINASLGNNPEAQVGESNNSWENPSIINKIKIRTVEFPRELRKEGNSFYKITPESGPMLGLSDLDAKGETKVLQGFIENSNVNVVQEMVKMISVQRNYEANQKSVTSHNQTLGKLINEVAR